jgi:hypothetical protein
MWNEEFHGCPMFPVGATSIEEEEDLFTFQQVFIAQMKAISHHLQSRTSNFVILCITNVEYFVLSSFIKSIKYGVSSTSK